MRFLSPAELKSWYQTGLEAFGYRSLEPAVTDLYLQLLEQGQMALPAGLLARWLEKLLQQVSGEQLPLPPSAADLLEQLMQGDGLAYLRGQYGLRPPAGPELQQLVSLVFGQLPLRHPQLHFAPRELQDLDTVAADPDFPAQAHLQEVLQGLIEHLQTRPLQLDPADLFEIRHAALFARPGARSLYRRLRSCCEAMAAWCDTHLQLEQEGPDVVRRYGQPEVLPLGGYDELTTRGDLAALLPSELALIDTGEAVDYFDYKYLHGELLYFQREEGQVFRIRRRLHLVLPLGAGMELERHLVPFLAFVLVLTQALREVFAKDILHLDVWLPAARLPSTLQQGLDFIGQLLCELELEQQVQLHPGQHLAGHPAVTSEQLWLLSADPGPLAPEWQWVPLSYPDLDSLQALSEAERLRHLGECINQTLLALVARAGQT